MARAGGRAWAKRSSDCEGRRPGGIGLGGIGRKNVLARRRANGMRVAVEPFRQDRQVGRHKGHGLQGAAAERALVAAIAARPMLARRAVVVDVGAELGIIAEQRLELGGDRRFIGAGEGGRRKRGRRRDGEKLDEERERDDERGQRRTPRTPSPRSAGDSLFGPDRPCGTPYAPARRSGKTVAPASRDKTAAKVARLGRCRGILLQWGEITSSVLKGSSL